MLARMCKIDNVEGFVVLLSDGTIKGADKAITTYFLTSFKNIEIVDMFRNGELGRWDSECSKMEQFSGETYGYITDSHDLVIKNWEAFDISLQVNQKIDNLLSVKEYADLHGKSEPMIKVLCREGRLQGAARIGNRAWVIPADCPYPEDCRYTAGGKYVGYNRR